MSLSTSPVARRAWLGALLLAAASGAALAAEPAQIPLSSRVSDPPTPNVMVTIDDSGSMLADYVPEGSFTLNGWTGSLISGWVSAFPGDWRKLCSDAKASCSTPPKGWAWDTGNYLDGTVTSVKGGTGETNFQRRFRSPDVNKIFYNPDVRYQPWWKPDGSARMANAIASAARFDPIYNSGTINLTAKLTGKTRWYTGPTSYVDESRDFYPGLVYRLKAGGNPDVAANWTRYDINVDGEHAPTTKHPNRTDCAGTRCTQTEERQNFANWFTYYRMRELLTKGAVSESLYAFKDKLRVGWGRINKTSESNIDGINFSVIETPANGGPIRQFNAARMQTVLTGVQNILSWPSTPLRTALDEVGSYFKRDSSTQGGSPWLEDPGTAGSAKLACRRSVSLLMTDGYYNDSYSGAGDVDGVNGPDYAGANPNGYTPTRYTAEKPYIDGPPTVSNTLADVAMKYFVNDLDPTIDNKVWTVDGDIAFWQHLTQFMVGFGVKGTLDSSTAEKKAETLALLKSGAVKWPNPTSGSPQKIDDMWHAAVNTGGDFYSVSNVTELTEALVDAFGKAAGSEAKEAGVSVAMPFTAADNVKYVPKYKSVSWYGDVEAYELSETGKQESLKWKASDAVPAAANRNLFTWDGTSGVQFKWGTGGMGSVNQALVGTETLTNFIRGDHSQEGDGKLYRDRGGKVLGDFVNSPPVLVGSYLNHGYSAIDGSYTDYLVSKRTGRLEPLVVVGGNGGMLHFFRGSDGTEVFGYLPRTGLPNLKLIADKDYGGNDNFHRFFVDGPMTETDVKIGGQWTNVVVGAMGAGGKSFFTLRIPTAYGTPTATDFGASTVLWEKTGATDADIGYMFADFAAGKVKNGGWKIFVGNGVYSTNGNAVLLVVDVETGNIDKKITVATGGDTGLMGVSLMRDATTGEVVGAYAGDMKGNLWRFDFEGGAPSDWKAGFGGEPLFVATDAGGQRQPITAPPVYVAHGERGRVVLFGTGKLVDEADSLDSETQTYYGVWDPTEVGASSVGDSSPFNSISPDRSALQVQTILTDPITDDNGTYYKVDSKEVDWNTHKGWLIDLPWSRQRVIYPSMVLAGEYVYFSSLVPAAPAEQCDVSTGEGYNFLLRAVDGGVLTDPVFDTDGDGDIDDEDQVVQGKKALADGRDGLILDGGGDGGDPPTDSECVNGWRTYYFVDTTGNVQQARVPCTSSDGPKDRVWKQIVNPPTGG
ncbi:pilus assembly protein [Ideonella sp.]|uniref:pilus assembly protein n=1 Tax=Ideonella sp. TaxID=1929293 RepID=UPI0035AEF996